MEIKILTVEELTEKRVALGQSEKKIKSASQVFEKTPESGKFSHIGEKEFDIPGVGKRTSLGLYLTDGRFVSENTIQARNTLGELVVVKSGDHKGKFRLKSEKISDLTKWGGSQDIQLTTLQGKSFTTTKIPGRTLIDFQDSSKMVAHENSQPELERLLKNTDAKDFYRFNIL